MILHKISEAFRFKTFILFISFNIAVNAFAQNWTGNVNSDWNNPANWTGWPLNGDNILIDTINYTGVAASPVITTNSVFIPDGVVLQNGAQLHMLQNLTANGRIELIGAGTSMTINAGVLHAAGSGSEGRLIVSEGATLNMNGGTVTASQRVIVELGGAFILNNGTVSSLELAIGDGNALGGSLFDMNGGAVIVDDVSFENETGTFYPSMEMSSGTLTISGGMAWFGELPGSGTPRFIMTGGNASVGGDIMNDPASTVDLYISLSGNASLAFNGTALTLVHTTDSIIQADAAQVIFSNTNVFSNTGAFYSTGGLTVFNGNSSLVGTGTYMFSDVAINTAKQLNQVSPAISLIGDFSNDGVFNPNSGTVHFEGTVSQLIEGSSVTSFNGLTLNNSSVAGLSLNSAIIVTDSLLLTNGKLNSSASNIITLTDNAGASSGSALSFVNGPLQKTGDDSFVFPVGKNDRWRRLSISAPASVSSVFTAEYMDSAFLNLSAVNAPLYSVSAEEYWQLDRSGSTSDVQVSLFWEDASSSLISDCAELSMAHWNESNWDHVPANVLGNCAGAGSGSAHSLSALNDLGIYTFGFYSNSVGVVENTSLDKLHIFPNPGNGMIRFSSDNAGSMDLHITNTFGQTLVKKQDVSSEDVINLSSQPNGIYFIEIIQNGNVSRLRFVKE